MKGASTLCAALVLLLTSLLSFSVEASQRSLRARSDKVLVSDGADGAQDSVSSKGVKANQKDDGDEAEDDDDDDDEDDDDEQDDAESDKGKAPVYKTKGSANRTKAAPSIITKKGEEEEDDLDVEDDFNKILHPHAKEKAKMQKSIQKIEKELASNLKKQAELKSKLSFLLNHKESDAQIDTAAKQVANETESLAMATMLSKMWKEMRMFEVPVYAQHVEEERQQLKKEEKALEKKLREEQAKLVEARKKWAKDAKEMEQEQEGAKGKEQEHGSADAEVAKAEKEVQGAANQVAPGGEWKEYAGYQNFWRLNSQQQRSMLEGSVIYLLFGILAAYLYHLGVTKYPKAFSPSPKQAAIPRQTSFTFNLLGCFDDKIICALGCCCPCLRWSQTMDKANVLSYFKAFAAMYFLMLIHPYTAGLSSLGIVVLGAVYRQKLRRKYGIENRTAKTVCADIATWIFCQPCAVCQEAREEAVTRGRVQAPMV